MTDLILQIFNLALAVAKNQFAADDRGFVEKALLEIIRKGIRAYEEHTGRALDPALIRAEVAI